MYYSLCIKSSGLSYIHNYTNSMTMFDFIIGEEMTEKPQEIEKPSAKRAQPIGN